MTTPITMPPGEVSTWGIIQALNNEETWISYIGVDGSIWYLAGPLAPVAGAQDGMVLSKFMGLMSPFEQLQLQGARQDGATFQDAVYNVGEIMLSVEATGTSPQNIRNVLRQWVSAWDAIQTGVLSVFTPDMGEWFANVRMGKNIIDMFTQDYTFSGKQKLTWEAKNYDAFWFGVDSTDTFGISFDSLSESFTQEANSSTLNSANWTQTISPSGTGSTYGISDGAATVIDPSGTTPITVMNINTAQSATNNQVVAVILGGANLFNLFNFSNPGATFDIFARLNEAGTEAVQLSVGLEQFSLSFINGDTTTTLFELPLAISPFIGETWTLIAGTDVNEFQYVIQRNGFTIMDFTDSANASAVGASNRFWGFGAQTSTLNGSAVLPPPIAAFEAADNAGSGASGFVNLTNFGDQEAWPRYLCYGPGTFTFNNGAGSTAPITFGPLVDGQIVLITTEPQLRSIVDLSPTQPPQVLDTFQSLLSDLISFATNNNTPPLLQQFESLFGILPPQGNLFQLLNGRFTNSLPGAFYGTLPTTQQIAVSISGGSPTSKIVAAISPRRRWPL